ncbi:hypothetical protein [Nocardia wallacei]|uniref:hypothetical protein n=1 Tax=Nocardia wallacei TaxID=480035 RepID=UPI002458997D|nr:hypothetical protein [Nocardia wallacei]
MTDRKSTERGTYETADDLLNSRRDWLGVYCVEVEPGAFDIVLKIDGTYFDRAMASAAADAYARDICRLLDRFSGPGTSYVDTASRHASSTRNEEHHA